MREASGLTARRQWENGKFLKKRAAYVPQENPLIPELSARDNFALWYKGDKREWRRT